MVWCNDVRLERVVYYREAACRVAIVVSAVVYALSIAGMVFPRAWLLAPGFLIRAITAMLYILGCVAAREAEVSLRLVDAGGVGRARRQ